MVVDGIAPRLPAPLPDLVHSHSSLVVSLFGQSAAAPPLNQCKFRTGKVGTGAPPPKTSITMAHWRLFLKVLTGKGMKLERRVSLAAPPPPQTDETPKKKK